MRGGHAVSRAAALVALLLAAAPAAGQIPDGVRIEPDGARRLPGLWFAAAAADSILATPDASVGLEAFQGDTVTGVYLRGTFRGAGESVAYGRDQQSRRYVWFSVARGDSLEYVALLYDVDTDLTPDYLLFRTVDQTEREEDVLEYRGPAAVESDIDVQVSPACQRPGCDPTTWTVKPRTRIRVEPDFFAPWRGVFGLAATRGEAWLGKSRELFVERSPDDGDGAP